MSIRRGITPCGVVGTLAVGVSLLLSRSALADKEACITAHATGQREARAGHLRLAARLFTTCGSDETCPDLLRQECAEFLRSTEQTIPSVIFLVIGNKNQDISNVKVFSSDALIVDGLDGRAIQLDPGRHHLRFVLPTGEILNNDVLVREGEKNRMIEIRVKDEVEDGAATTEQLAPAHPAAVAPPLAAERRTVPIAFWIASGAAVAALGVGVTYAVLGKSEKNDLADCAPNCGNSMRDTYDNLKRDYLIADVGFAVGIVSAGVAAWLLVSSPSRKKEPPPAQVFTREATWRLIPAGVVTNSGGTLSWSGRF